MTQLRREYQEFVRRGAEIIAVGPENRDAFLDYWEKNEMPFIGIPDPEHVSADLYGQRVSLVRGGRMPAMFLIDNKGIVRFEHYGGSMSDIPGNKSILELLDDLNRESVEGDGDPNLVAPGE
jgi:peroxiredoxin Q/BCP